MARLLTDRYLCILLDGCAGVPVHGRPQYLRTISNAFDNQERLTDYALFVHVSSTMRRLDAMDRYAGVSKRAKQIENKLFNPGRG